MTLCMTNYLNKLPEDLEISILLHKKKSGTFNSFWSAWDKGTRFLIPVFEKRVPLTLIEASEIKVPVFFKTQWVLKKRVPLTLNEASEIKVPDFQKNGFH